MLPINKRHLVFSNGTLVIEKVQSGVDGGSYRCEATNKQGNTARGTAQINVMGMLQQRVFYSFIILTFQRCIIFPHIICIHLCSWTKYLQSLLLSFSISCQLFFSSFCLTVSGQEKSFCGSSCSFCIPQKEK